MPQGWAAYMRHDVRYAGLALAFIYMTVLGFDNITWGYSLMQCVTESILGTFSFFKDLFFFLRGSRVGFPISPEIFYISK